MRWTLAIIGVLGVVAIGAGRYQVGQPVSETFDVNNYIDAGRYRVGEPVRYQVGQPVSLGVYTETFDVNDPAYKFMQIIYGDPNSQTLQAAPDDWVQQFGNSERTLLLHAVSELRVVVASQGRAIMDLEARIDEMELRHEESDPNGGGE